MFFELPPFISKFYSRSIYNGGCFANQMSDAPAFYVTPQWAYVLRNNILCLRTRRRLMFTFLLNYILVR